MGLLSKCKKGVSKETTGRFDSRQSLEKFVIGCGKDNVKIKLIVEQSGASRKAVDRILKMNNVDNSHKNTAAINGAKEIVQYQAVGSPLPGQLASVSPHRILYQSS